MFLGKNWLRITIVTVGILLSGNLTSHGNFSEPCSIFEQEHNSKNDMPSFWKDLRGKGFSDADIGKTVLEYSKTHLMILTALKDSPHDLKFGALIRKVVQEQIDLGRINIIVMVIDKDEENIETGMQFVVKEKMPAGVMSTAKSPELRMTVGIEVFYDGQNYPKKTD